MGDPAYMMWTILFSALGFGYFQYGRKQGRSVPLISGIVLMIYPYFIPNIYAMVAIGCVITALPYFVRI